MENEISPCDLHEKQALVSVAIFYQWTGTGTIFGTCISTLIKRKN